jgi:hypothetical protein
VGRSALTLQQRTKRSLPLELLFTSGGEEVFRNVPCFPLILHSGFRKFGPSLDLFDHADALCPSLIGWQGRVNRVV